jgi:hypothetical protein
MRISASVHEKELFSPANQIRKYAKLGLHHNASASRHQSTSRHKRFPPPALRTIKGSLHQNERRDVASQTGGKRLNIYIYSKAQSEITSNH